MGSRIKFCGEVDVARGGGVTSSNGTEQRQMTDTSPPEFGLVRPQGADDALGEISCARAVHAEIYHAGACRSATA